MVKDILMVNNLLIKGSPTKATFGCKFLSVNISPGTNFHTMGSELYMQNTFAKVRNSNFVLQTFS